MPQVAAIHPPHAGDRRSDRPVLRQLPRVSTWLTSAEQRRVAMAESDRFVLTHRTTLDQVLRDLQTEKADVLLISVALIDRLGAVTLASVRAGIPSLAVTAIICDAKEAQVLSGVLLLGRAGVEHLADLREPRGWEALRSGITACAKADAFVRDAITGVLDDIGDADDRCGRFVRALFDPRVTSAKQLAWSLGVLPTTLISWFFRAGLPSPKQYLAHARLVQTARLGEAPGLTLGDIAARMHASSPQAWHRFVKTSSGQTANTFRQSSSGGALLRVFREQFIHPHRDTLRALNAIGRVRTPSVPTLHVAAGSPARDGMRRAS